MVNISNSAYRRFETSIILIILALAVTVGIIALYLTNQSINEDVTRRATSELQLTAIEQADLINQRLGEQFEPLEILASYLEQGDFLDEDYAIMTEATVKENHWCTVAVADSEGLATNYTGEIMGSVADREYFSNVIDGSQERVVQYLPVTLKVNEPRFIFSVPIYKDGEISGVLFASKQVSVLEPILLGNTATDEFTNIFLIQSDGTILSANENAHESLQSTNYFEEHDSGEYLDGFSEEKLREAMERGESGSFQYRCNGTETVFYVPTGINDWYLLAQADQAQAEAKYAENMKAIRKNVYIVMLVFCFLIALIVVLLLYYARKIKKTEDLLSQEREQLYENELRESQVRNSISQMQPHFLYNALASIREIILEDPQYASDLVCDFTTHLRACVKSMTNSDLVPFQSEMENVKAYVNIEKMRFGEKLGVVYDIQAQDFQIAPLTVQPLVENAIRHGIYQRGSQGGTVKISAKEKEGKFIICVQDDGVGFDYAQIQQEIASGQRDSTGLANLSFRIESMLDGHVFVESELGKGTTIRIEIPAISEREKEEHENDSGR